MNRFDLQIQSIASDGRHTPSEIVAMARDGNLETIALTDHDTVAGVEEFLLASREAGIQAIPGIELSVKEHNVHMLGFGVNHIDPHLIEKTEEFEQSRIGGAKKMIENLKTNEGFVIEWEDVLAEADKSSTVTRPHIVRAIMNRPENQEKLRKDGVREKADFFSKYLSDTGRNFVSRAHISASDGIKLIHEAGGVAVWSHPPIPDFTNGVYDELEKFLQELISWGIDGVEVWSASHREDDVEFLYALTQKYKLLRTGGSDFHEAGSHPREASGLHSADRIGDFETYGFPTDDVVPRLREAIAQRSGS